VSAEASAAVCWSGWSIWREFTALETGSLETKPGSTAIVIAGKLFGYTEPGAEGLAYAAAFGAKRTADMRALLHAVAAIDLGSLPSAPFGEVRSLKRLSEMEWAEYWGATQEVSDRNGGTYRLPGRLWHFSRETLKPLGDPASQGEHNRMVFGELGLSEAEIDGYVAGGALLSVALPATIGADADGANGSEKVRELPFPATAS
jgi:hypothetical protein